MTALIVLAVIAGYGAGFALTAGLIHSGLEAKAALFNATRDRYDSRRDVDYFESVFPSVFWPLTIGAAAFIYWDGHRGVSNLVQTKVEKELEKSARELERSIAELERANGIGGSR